MIGNSVKIVIENLNSFKVFYFLIFTPDLWFWLNLRYLSFRLRHLKDWYNILQSLGIFLKFLKFLFDLFVGSLSNVICNFLKICTVTLNSFHESLIFFQCPRHFLLPSLAEVLPGSYLFLCFPKIRIIMLCESLLNRRKVRSKILLKVDLLVLM